MVKNLQKFIIMMAVVSAILLPTREARASHAMGADLTYQCLGGNTYRIRVSFYRDCIGIAAPNNVYVNVRSASCGQDIGVTCNKVSGTGMEVTPLCSTAVSTCNGGVFTGIQEYVYEGVITLPMQCTDWEFSYNLCCRNAAITNITAPSSATFYIYATLNNTISPCNSSPTFSNKPVPFACIGQQYCFNHGAFDPDGDSLVYSLIAPFQTATTTVNYVVPFTATNPLSSTPALTFNTATGDICMTPTSLEVTVMAVLVSEYRNGVLIGTVERDIQITVQNCTNNLPSLTGINGTNNFSATVCAGQQLCFNINSADPDVLQNLTVTWDNSIPGATFTTTAGPRPVATFCWTPSTSNISANPYCFTVRVKDDACPFYGSQIYSFCIQVVGVTVNAGPDQLIACNGQANLTATASGSGNFTYLWSNGVTSPSQTVGIGTYIVTVSNGICSDQDTVQVISAFEPTAAFTYSGTCPNTPIQFTDQSTLPGGFITSWNWNFAGAGTSTLQNPVHSFPGPGTYNVTLIITTSLGCDDTITQPVTIQAPPTAAFTAGTACAGSTITFNNTTTPAGAYNWAWNFGNGQTSTQQNPSIVYSNPGTYTVTLIASAILGCVDTVIHQVIVNPNPVPAFTWSTTVCQGASITFNNTSQAGGGTITGYNWNFGNGQVSTSQNPTVVYASSGNYNVSLTVTNSLGCSATLIQNIGINAPPAISVSPNQSICLGGSVTLNAAGGVTYNWSPYGQTGSTISVNPSNTTTYGVLVTDGNGCTGTASVTVAVNPLPVINAIPDLSICLGQSAVISATGGVTYLWSPTGNTGNSITVTPSSSTTYAVTGTDANGCSSSDFVTVTVKPVPVVNLSNVFICVGSNAVLNAGNPGMTYQWSTGATSQTITVTNPGTYTVTVTNSFGCTASSSALASQSGTIVNTLQNTSFCAGGSTVLDAGNPGHTYLWSTGATTQTITVSAGGPYSVTITDNNGCTGTLSTTVNVNPLPVANFIPNDICINQPLQFNDISTIASGSIVAWDWNFGDGNVSQLQDPVHNYAASGTYSVTLTVTSNNGCTSTIVRTFTVFSLPQANFGYNFACENEPIQFTDQSSTSMGNITSWFWDFGDGTTSTLQNPIHTFAVTGMQTVTLTVSTGGGCDDTRPRNIMVYPIPDLAFTTDPGGVCFGETMTVTNNSTSSNGAINAWFWDFGDGTTSVDANPVHDYTNPGTYTVLLIAATSHGCADTISQTFTVNALPVVNAGPNQSICQGTSATLTSSPGVSYLWSNGATTQTTTVSPMTGSMYYVTVTDANGCTGTDSLRIFVRPNPTANAGSDKSICEGSSVTLNGSNVNLTPVWTPGNQTTHSITVSPTVTTDYVYTVTTSYGCFDSDTVRVTVNPKPLANAGPDQMICDGATATLTATGGATYNWSPTGETSSTIYVNPTLPTVYTVVVTSAFGCSATDTVSVGLNPTPVANISPAFICLGTSTILDAGNPGSTYLWSPNGETTQTISVSDSGFIQVLITNAFGCVGVASTVVAMGGTNLQINPTNVNICQGQVTTLNAQNPGSTYLWSTGATTQTINVSTSGIFTVTITDVSGCSASFPSNVVVNPLPQIQFTTAPTCFGEATQFTNTTTIASGNIATWNWTFGDNSSSNAMQPAHLYTNPGSYPVTLQATSGMGCVAQLIQQVSVDPKPQANFNANPVCAGQPTVFVDATTVASGSISSWNWNFGDGIFSTQQNPTHPYAAPGVYNVTLVAATGSGCTDTITKQVIVDEAPIVSFTGQNGCSGTALTFTNGSWMTNGIINSYTWDFGDGTTATTTDATHLFPGAGTYNVSLTAYSSNGCSATTSMSIDVYPIPVASATVQPVCEGDVSIFNNTTTISTGSVTGIYWNFGDGGSTNAQSPSHTYGYSGTYNVLLVATSDQGCVDTTNISAIVNPVPTAAFTAADACQGTAVQLTDQSQISSGSITSWNWNLGDGASASTQNPAHNYNAPGSYQVILAVTSNNGCIDSVSATVNVFGEPTAAFAGSNVCQGDMASFYNQSTIPGGGILDVTWYFGDGASDTLQNPQHTYTSPGIYSVTLVVGSAFGCTDSISQNITIYANPVADYTAINACDGSPINFTDLSTSSDGVISTWNWNLGDGSSSTSANPYHTYASSGSYSVSLTVTSLYGCANTVIDSVHVYSLPVPVITASTNCEYDPVSFTSVTAAGDTSTYMYQWSFGDGYTSNMNDPVHQYNGPGQYNVTLTMTNLNGCSQMASAQLEIYPAPVADFDYANGCQGSDVQFTNQSTIASGNISSYIWDFGDGSALSGVVDPIHIFNTSGVFTVTLIAISDNGCADTISQQITVYPLPVSNFTYNEDAGCGPLTVSFTDSSFISSGTIIAWSWDFGNGQTSALQNPTVIYSTSGTYGVTLTVTSDKGCSQTFTQPNIITIFPGPEANFVPDPYEASILNPVIEFNNLSHGASVYSWSFGDGGTSSVFEPTHTYADTGMYQVHLVVVNTFGCIDTISKWVHIVPIFTVYVPNAFTPNSDGVNDFFTVVGLGIEAVKVNIFNRWGENVYTFTDLDQGWNGTIQKNNNLAQQDVYVYEAFVKDVFGITHIKSGLVTLVR